MKPKGDTAGKEHPALSKPVLVHGVMAACLEKKFGTINPPLHIHTLQTMVTSELKTVFVPPLLPWSSPLYSS
jgi:hypothetical protein